MKTVNMHQAKTHLSRLVDEAAAGEDIIIAKAGKPVARLVAVTTSAQPRSLGALKGKVIEAADCWDPDPELEALFYGGDVEPRPVRRVAEPKPAKRKARGK
jgi:prevent-host-death family protein